MSNKFNMNQLLNNKSREVSGKDEKEVSRQKSFKVVLINVHDLVPSKDNFYSIEQIEELKTAIELVGGVKQNLNVVELEGGKYKVLAGHRRRLASLSLVEEGKKEYEFLPCHIEMEEEDTELNEIKEELLLIVTNSQRDKTDWDKIEEVRRLKIILERYKEKEGIPGRIRNIIAKTLNTSTTQVARMDAISNNLTEEFKEELKEEKINMSTAYELSGLTEEKQSEAFKEYEEKGSFTIKDVRQKKEEEMKVAGDPEEIKGSLDKLNNEVTEKLTKEYTELAEDYEKVSRNTTEEVDVIDFYRFVDFAGEETEKEFLEKCLEQWDMTIEKDTSDTNKIMEIGTVFREIRHRIAELE